MLDCGVGGSRQCGLNIIKRSTLKMPRNRHRRSEMAGLELGVKPGAGGPPSVDQVENACLCFCFLQSWWGRGVCGGGGRPACEPPSHRVRFVLLCSSTPHPRFRGRNSPHACSLSPWPRVAGTCPELGHPDASAWDPAGRAGRLRTPAPALGGRGLQHLEPSGVILTGCLPRPPGLVLLPSRRFCGSPGILPARPSSL